MQIAVDFSSANSPAVMEFFDSLVLDDDLPVLREACEDVHSGSPGVLSSGFFAA
jgi:hypothetical protein